MIPRNLQITLALLILSIVAAGVYILYLKSEAEKVTPVGVENMTPVAAPFSGPKTEIKLVIAYDQDGLVRVRDSSAALPDEPSARAQELLRVLLREYMQKPTPHQLGDGSDIHSVYMVPGGTCVVDLSANFAANHPSGTLVEQLSVVSLAGTLILNLPQIKKVKFLVDGHEHETLAGHVDLSPAYDSDSITQMMKELQY